MPLYLRPLAIVVASLVFPPVGLVLLWMRAGTGVAEEGPAVRSHPGCSRSRTSSCSTASASRCTAAERRTCASRAPSSRDEAMEASRSAQAQAPAVSVEPAAADPQPTRPVDAPAGSAAARRSSAPSGAPAAPAVAQPKGSTYWADFRGPGRLGHYDQAPILTTWPAEGLKRLWKQPSGGGYASFTVAHGVAFTIEQRREQRGGGRLRPADRARALDQRLERAVQRVDGRRRAAGHSGLERRDASTRWARPASSAASTPRAERPSGARTSSRTTARPTCQWGMAASPLVVDNAVIVQPGGPNGRSVVAYDKRTGERRLELARRQGRLHVGRAGHGRRPPAAAHVDRDAGRRAVAGRTDRCCGSSRG